MLAGRPTLLPPGILMKPDFYSSFKSLGLTLNPKTLVGVLLSMRKLLQPFVVVLIAIFTVAGGCGDLVPPRPPLNEPATEASPNAQVAPTDPEVETEKVTDEPFEGDWSDWYVHRFGSQVVGVSEIEASSLIDLEKQAAEETEVTYRREERLIFRTGRASFVRRISLRTVETGSGATKSFQLMAQTGPIRSTTDGQFKSDKLVIKTSGGGAEKERVLLWKTGTRGLFALEQTLRRRPPKKGESRRIPIVMPSLESVGTMELRCTGDASVAMLDGSYRLLREIDVRTFVDTGTVESLVVWINGQGGIEKTLRPELRLESFRADRATARSMFGDPQDGEVNVNVAGELREDIAPIRVAYVVADKTPPSSEQADGEASGAPIDSVLKPIAHQSVRRIEGGLHVLVASDAKTPNGFESDNSVSLPVDTKPTNLIDFHHADVARMSKTIGELPPRDLASELARLVRNDLSLIGQGDLNAASASIRAGRAGFVDQAVVLASLLRAREIPSRVAFGLSRRTQGENGVKDRTTMTLSAWVVAWIDGSWVAIDPLTTQFNRSDQLCFSCPSGDADLAAEIGKVFRRVAEVNFEIRGAKYE